MSIADPYIDELLMEASTTRRVLERVPEAHLNWRPHEKSMSLGNWRCTWRRCLGS